MSMYTLLTGREQHAPLAAGGATMSASALTRWRQACQAVLFALLLSCLPSLALAQGSSDPNLDFGMAEGDSQQIITSLYSIWQLVANGAVYIGAAVALIALTFGLGARWVYIATAIAIIGGFGEWAVQWILDTGGMELIDRQST